MYLCMYVCTFGRLIPLMNDGCQHRKESIGGQYCEPQHQNHTEKLIGGHPRKMKTMTDEHVVKPLRMTRRRCIRTIIMGGGEHVVRIKIGKVESDIL